MRFALEGEKGIGDGGVEWQPRTPAESFVQNSPLRKDIARIVMTPAVKVEGIPYADSMPESYFRPPQATSVDRRDLPA